MTNKTMEQRFDNKFHWRNKQHETNKFSASECTEIKAFINSELEKKKEEIIEKLKLEVQCTPFLSTEGYNKAVRELQAKIKQL